MEVRAYVYDSSAPAEHVEAVLDRLEDRPEEINYVDIDAAETRADGRREAMLTVKNAVGIGTPPDELYGPDGRPDLTVGALITEEPTGRRSLHVGTEALDALDT
ncbi:hypothetical protein GRX03_09520 [Halovenus sp. WSH3]|uniref:Uncharacterized protein n=1 Tax=Halovenus carboxidivorans TaxID=2692199 RepID=A0A6B0T8A2_9EURY|nr:hypothetical protein [Halovenus carboxidivorans]MXR51843.1 hypothetical protein [Halovenus carboxidivorans]